MEKCAALTSEPRQKRRLRREPTTERLAQGAGRVPLADAESAIACTHRRWRVAVIPVVRIAVTYWTGTTAVSGPGALDPFLPRVLARLVLHLSTARLGSAHLHTVALGRADA